jgi:histidine triad (HIT) family protein
MSDCIFCKIVNGEIPSYKIYEDENYLAFLDIFPAVAGYTLVIPKKHYRWVWDVENIGEYFEVCKKIAQHYQKVINDERVYSMIIGEEVPHAHIRIVPGNDEKFNEKLYKFLEESQSKEMLSKEKAEELVEKLKIK